jgi:hypothetical protein
MQAKSNTNDVRRVFPCLSNTFDTSHEKVSNSRCNVVKLPPYLWPGATTNYSPRPTRIYGVGGRAVNAASHMVPVRHKHIA